MRALWPERRASQRSFRRWSPVRRATPTWRSACTRSERIVALQGTVGDATAHRLPAGLRIRPATPADVSDLERVDRACFTEFWRYGPAELSDSLRSERVTVVESARGVIDGYSTCAAYGATVTVGRLAVAPEARRQGIARALLSDVASWAERSGAYTLSLCTQEANDASRALYAAAGLAELPERYLLAAGGA